MDFFSASKPEHLARKGPWPVAGPEPCLESFSVCVPGNIRAAEQQQPWGSSAWDTPQLPREAWSGVGDREQTPAGQMELHLLWLAGGRLC